MKMTTCEKQNDDSAAEFQALRQGIELDEPLDLPVLNILIHNELSQAINNTKNMYHIGWFRRCFAQWNVCPPQKWKKLKD